MNTAPAIYDVAIIGAGPAGSACALALHDSGLRVLLVDKEHFPRDKICGDAIPGQTLKAMDIINPEWGRALRQNIEKAEVHASRIYAPGGRTIQFNWKMQAYNCKRIHFDHFLLDIVRQQTTATILEGQRISETSIGPEYAVCRFTEGAAINARIVIGCDGANSVVARHSATTASSHHASSAAVRTYCSGIDGLKPGVNEFHLFADTPGYFWIFPLPDGQANVGFGLSGSHQAGHGHKPNLRNSLMQIINEDKSIGPRFKNAVAAADIKGFGLPVWSRRRPVSGYRYMLCGDAAALIDPLQGHGIDKAVWSGLLAAEQVKKCFAENDFSAPAMADYDKKLHRKFGHELARSRYILNLISRYPGLIAAVARIGNRKGAINWIIRRLKI